MRGHIIWHELLTLDPKAAISFYTKVVGWSTEVDPNMPDYTLWTAKRVPMGGLMAQPAESRAMGAPPSWLTYIATPDADGTVRQATALGARVYVPVRVIPSVGRFAVLADPQGAAFAILQPEPAQPRPDEEKPAVLGDFSWHDLATTDWQAAWRFYSQLFGWQQTDRMDMGPAGIYQMFGRKGATLGGMYNKPPEVPVAHWLPYALVKNADAAAATAAKLGAKILRGPMEVPGGDRIAMLVDPQGAAFAVHSKAAPQRAPKRRKKAKKVTRKAAKRRPARRKAARRKTVKKRAPRRAPSRRRRRR